MSIVERILRITKANLHHVLDQVDTPEMEVRDKIEGLQRAIGEAHRALAGMGVTRRKLKNEMEQLERGRGRAEQAAETAVQADDDGAARRALRERLRAEEAIEKLRPSLGKTAQAYEELKADLLSRHEQLKAAQLRLVELQSRKQAAAARAAVAEKIEGARKAALGEDDFTRLEEDVLESESVVEIDREVRREMQAIDADLSDTAPDTRVDAELEALKKQVKGT